MYQGQVHEVTVVPLGDELIMDHAANATTLQLTSVSDFDDAGGLVRIDYIERVYSGVDRVNDTMSLSSALGTAMGQGTKVNVSPLSTDKWALVEVDPFNDAIFARVGHSLYDRLQEGIREAIDREYVQVDMVDNEWVVVDIVAKVPDIDGSFLIPETVPISDGLPPSSSPTPQVVAGLNAFLVSVDPIINRDPVTYNFYIGKTSPVPISGSNLAGSTEATLAYIGTDGDGAPLEAGVPYYIRVVASDRDGAAPPGVEVSSTALQTPSAVDLSELEAEMNTLINTTLPAVQAEVTQAQTTASNAVIAAAGAQGAADAAQGAANEAIADAADAAAAAALAQAAGDAAAELANSKGRIYFSDTPPPSPPIGIRNLVATPEPRDNGYYVRSGSSGTLTYTTNSQGRTAARSTRASTAAYALYCGRSGAYPAPVTSAEAGKVYTLMYRLRSNVDTTVTHQVGYGTATATLTALNANHVLVANQEVEVRRTITIPAGGWVGGQLLHKPFWAAGASNLGDWFEFSDALWVEGVYDGPWFDGDTPDDLAEGLAYGWAGEPHGSVSYSTGIEVTYNLWINTSGGNNTPMRWDGGAWVIATDKKALDAADAAAAAALAANAAQATADGKNRVYRQNTVPVAPAGGHKTNDVWFHTGEGNRMYVWTGVWTATVDEAIAAAATAASNAAIAAAGAQTAANDAQAAADDAQATADTINNTTLPQFSQYMQGQLAGIGQAAAAAQTAADNAQTAATTADGKAVQAAADAAAAAGIANGKGKTLIQSDAPAVADRLSQNLWIDTTNGANTPKRWDGSAWLEVTDKTAKDAATAAANAQTTATNAATAAANAATAAGNAQTTANGKNRVWYQTAQPSNSGNTTGDVWYDTDDGYRMYNWSGSAWTPTQFGTNALTNNAVTSAKLATAVTTSITTAQTTATNAGTAAATAQTAANNAQTAANTADGKAVTAKTAADAAAADAAAAAGIANSKGKVLIQPDAPAAADRQSQNLWIDTTGNANVPKRWTGSVWEAVTDKAATDAAAAAVAAQTTATNAANAASAAQSTANTAVTNAATAQTAAETANSVATAAQLAAEGAQSTANNKNKITYSTAAPGSTANIAGDLWFVKSGATITQQWEGMGGTTWQQRTLTDTVIANLDAGKITSGFISAARIAAGTITAATGIIADAAITTAKIADLAVSTAKIADLAVNNAKISTLDAAKITTGFLDAGRIAAKTITSSMMTIVGDNLLDNAGFDAPLQGGAIPGWALGGSANIVTTPLGSNNSTQAFRGVDGSAAAVLNRSSVPLFVQPGDVLRLRARVAIQGASVAGAYELGVTSSANGGSLAVVATNVATASDNTAYQLIEGLWTVPSNWGPGAQTAYVRFVARTVVNGRVTFWDDLQVARAADGSLIVDGAITAGKIAAGSIGVGSAIIVDAAITNAKIAALAVSEAKIADLAVTNAKIGALAVNTAKIADAAITTAKIGNAQITTALIGDAQIVTAKIADAQITDAKISTLDAAKITTGFLAAGRLAAGTITAANGIIADAAITTAKIADLAVSTAKIANLAVSTAQIGDLAVTNAKIGLLAVGTAQIADLAVTNAKVGSLDATKITTGFLGADRIESGSIVADKIGAGAITTIKLAADSVSAVKILTDAIETRHIIAGAVKTNQLDALAVTAAKIAAGAIIAEKIGAGEITGTKISGDALDGKVITGGTLQTSATNVATVRLSGTVGLETWKADGTLGVTSPITGAYAGALVVHGGGLHINGGANFINSAGQLIALEKPSNQSGMYTSLAGGQLTVGTWDGTQTFPSNPTFPEIKTTPNSILFRKAAGQQAEIAFNTSNNFFSLQSLGAVQVKSNAGDATLEAGGSFDKAWVKGMNGGAEIQALGGSTVVRNQTGDIQLIVGTGSSFNLLARNSGTGQVRLETNSGNVEVAPGNNGGFLVYTPGSGHITLTSTSGNLYLGNAGSGVVASARINGTAGSGTSVVVTSSGVLQKLTSSERYKEDIRPWLGDPKKVLDLPLYTFLYSGEVERWNDRDPDDPDSLATEPKRQFGTIAERAHELGLRYLVSMNEEGLPDTVHYERIGAMLVPTVAEHEDRIDELEDEMLIKDAVIEDLTSRLEALEAMLA